MVVRYEFSSAHEMGGRKVNTADSLAHFMGDRRGEQGASPAAGAAGNHRSAHFMGEEWPPGAGCVGLIVRGLAHAVLLSRHACSVQQACHPPSCSFWMENLIDL
jgi:hypothetical protein